MKTLVLIWDVGSFGGVSSGHRFVTNDDKPQPDRKPGAISFNLPLHRQINQNGTDTDRVFPDCWERDSTREVRPPWYWTCRRSGHRSSVCRSRVFLCRVRVQKSQQRLLGSVRLHQWTPDRLKSQVVKSAVCLCGRVVHCIWNPRIFHFVKPQHHLWRKVRGLWF